MKTLAVMLALAVAPAASAKDPAAPQGEKAKKPAAAAPKAAKGAALAKDAQAAKPAGPTKPIEPPPPYQWRVPGLLQWVDSAGEQLSEGVPMHLEMALSDRSIEELIQHFADDFEAAKLYIPPDEHQTSPYTEPRLTAFDPVRNIAYTVIFQSNAPQRTTLYLATADMSRYKPPGAASLEWAPVMPGAQKLLRTELEGAQSATYGVKGSEADVLDFHRKALKPLGFKEEEPGLFVRGEESLRVSSEQQGELRVVSLLRQGGARAPMAAPATP